MKYFINRISMVSAILLLLFILPVTVIAQNQNIVFKKHNAPVKAIAFSIDGKMMATGGEDKMIYLWNLSSGEMIGSISNPYTVKALQFMPDRSLLAACGNDIKLMDLEGKIIRTFGGYTTDIWCLSYSKPANRITAGSYAKNVRVWDFLTGKTVITLEGHEKSCLSVCYNPSGKTIATGSLDKSIRIWDASSGAQTAKLELHSENIFSIAFHPSGKYFASASADKTIRLWKADSAKIIRTYIGHKAAVFDVQFSIDGNYLLSCDADKTIILWETATGKKINVFSDHTGAVNSIRFSPDGSGFASCSDDQTVIFRNLDKKMFLAGTFYEKEIEKAVSGSPLFVPRLTDESRQEYSLREAEANKLLNDLYEKYYKEYTEMLNNLPIESK